MWWSEVICFDAMTFTIRFLTIMFCIGKNVDGYFFSYEESWQKVDDVFFGGRGFDR